MQPVLIYSSELEPIISKAKIPWGRFTLPQKMAAVKTVLRRRNTPASLLRLSYMNKGVSMALAFQVVQG